MRESRQARLRALFARFLLPARLAGCSRRALRFCRDYNKRDDDKSNPGENISDVIDIYSAKRVKQIRAPLVAEEHHRTETCTAPSRQSCTEKFRYSEYTLYSGFTGYCEVRRELIWHTLRVRPMLSFSSRSSDSACCRGTGESTALNRGVAVVRLRGAREGTVRLETGDWVWGRAWRRVEKMSTE